MNVKSIISVIVSLLALTVLESCCKSESDEQLREDMIGTWYWDDCKFPNNVDPQGVSESNPLYSRMVFRADGSFAEMNGEEPGFCSFDPNLGGTTTCQWEIENGNLIIIPNINWSIPDHVLQEFPIKCVNNNRLVFDNTEITYLGYTYTVKIILRILLSFQLVLFLGVQY